MSNDELDAFVNQVMAETDQAFEMEIPDERQTHVIDNDATIEVADSAPVDPGELDEAYNLAGNTDVLGDENIRGSEIGPFRDDFVEEMNQQAASQIGPSGELLEEFDQRWQHQQQKHETLGETAPFARIAPPSALQGILGGQALVTSGTAPILNPTVAYWTGDDAETLPVSVLLGNIAPVALPPAGTKFTAGTTFRPFAIVQFGTRGFLLTAEVDIGTGAQFTIPCSQVIVQVAMDADNSGGSGNSSSLTLTAMISFYQITHTKPVTRTRYIDAVGGGSVTTNQVVTVPPFAKDVAILQDSSSGGFTANFCDGASNPGVSMYSITVGAPNAQQIDPPVPLSSNIAQIQIVPAGGGYKHVQLIFNLCL